ncbi:PilN domain-containing protein [Roseiconus lacunae]|uniref:PilN domain-containing protein n=1 Tax=Roseiconus lacunae TaxID=2605694 RepID=UPI0011F10932|nr:PilN domain-containing protein [Roseiconus lacunae]
MDRIESDLLESVGEERAVVDRRDPAGRSVAGRSRGPSRFDRRRKQATSVGLEISPSGLSLAFIESENETQRLVVDRLTFPEDAGPRRGDWHDGTLQSRLTELVQKHQLTGQAVHCSIGGNPCVTRVIAGLDQHVDNELTELTGRTERYIGMGTGEKVLTDTTYRIDAKRKRVWVTIAIRDVVEAIAAAVRAAGLRLANLEHTMLVLSRLLNTYQCDDSEPVLMVVDDLGKIDLGISYQGRLLLDYRPALTGESVDHVEVIQRHLKCLRRYTQSQFPDSSSNLQQVFVAEMSPIGSGFQGEHDQTLELSERVYPFERLCEGIVSDQIFEPDTSMIAAICLAKSQQSFATNDHDTNNLATTLRMEAKIPWGKLIRATWPIGVVVAASFILALLSYRIDHAIERTDRQIELRLSDVDQSETLREKLVKRMSFDESVHQVEDAIDRRQWAQIVWLVGEQLPDRTWLESIQFHNDGTLQIIGVSRSDNGVFDYLDRLRNNPRLSRVALQTTSSHRGASTTDVRFEISATVGAVRSGENLASTIPVRLSDG